MNRILAVCLNPTFQRTVSLEKLDKGEVNRASEARVNASGRGINIARVLSQLGSTAVHLTLLGPGEEEFLNLCREDFLDVVWTDSVSPIRTCITLHDSDEASTTKIIEPTRPVGADTVDEIRKAFTEELTKTNWVVISGTKAPGYPIDLYADFCSEARAAGTPVVVDFQGEELLASLPHRSTVVKVNLVEFCATFLPDLMVSEADDFDVLPGVTAKLTELSGGGVDYVLTRGARDIYCAHAGRVTTVRPQKIVPVNTLGSGDSVAAGMAHALAAGANLEDAVSEGARCGGLNALKSKPGSII